MKVDHDIAYQHAARFIHALTGVMPDIRCCTFQTLDDNQARRDHRLTRVLHGSMAEHFHSLVGLNEQGAAISVAVNQTNGAGRKKSDIVGVRAFHLDVERKDVGRPPLEPSIVTETKRGLHFYWLAAPATPLDSCERVNRAIARSIDGGDTGACDASRVLRVPGFFHLKDPADPFFVRLVEVAQTGRRYSVSEMLAAFPEAPPNPLPPNPPAAEQLPLAARRQRASAYLARIPAAVSEAGGHAQTFEAARTLVRGFALPDDVAFDLLVYEYNPRCLPPWSNEELRHKVESARLPRGPADPPVGYLLESPSVSVVADDIDKFAPTMAALYTVADLQADRHRKLISFAALPLDHGLGSTLERQLGGGFDEGFVLAVGARSAAKGKTALVHQLSDGFALKTAELLRSGHDGPVTPVLMASEMTSRQLAWRSVARTADVSASVLRAGNSAPTLVGPNVNVDETYLRARAVLESGLYAEGRSYFRKLEAQLPRGARVLDVVADVVSRWSEKLKRDLGREVHPVVVLDPLQRWRDYGENEIDAVNALVEQAGAVGRRHGWITLLTSDTNATSARGGAKGGDTQASAASIFRGTYELLHMVDAALVLDSHSLRPGISESDEVVSVRVLKNRWGPGLPSAQAGALFDWIPTRMRFVPWSSLPAKAPNETAVLDEIDREARWPGSKHDFLLCEEEEQGASKSALSGYTQTYAFPLAK